MNSFKISNFRIFGSSGTEVTFKPITILTGTNSSGKSSFVKALVLFKDYLDKLRDDYRKEEYFNPTAYSLDFTRPDLGLKGFSNVLNKHASHSQCISFSYQLDLDLIGSYVVEYIFKSEKDARGIETGVIDTIIISSSDSNILFKAKNKDGKLRIEEIDANGTIYTNFLIFELIHILPHNIIKSYSSEYDLFDEHGVIDFDKLSQTEEGQKLYSLQAHLYHDLEKPYFAKWDHINASKSDELENFYNLGLLDILGKTLETSSLFYFPVLEKFNGKCKAECVHILRSEVKCPELIKQVFPYANPCESRGFGGIPNGRVSCLEAVIADFEKSNYNSFMEYYISLENEQMSSFQSTQSFPVFRDGKNYDFIEDEAKHNLDISFDSMGINSRDSMFQKAYNLLSAWQWYEDGGDENEYIRRSKYIDGENDQFTSRHKIQEAYTSFLEYVFKLAIMPDDLTELIYFNGSFSTVHRLHSFEENSIFTQTVSNFLENSRNIIRYQADYIPGSFSNKWLKAFKIGNEISIDVDDEGLGFKLYITDSDGRRESLADKGHGATQMVALLLLLENAIMAQKLKNVSSFNMYKFNSKATDTHVPPILIIEEPEVSMHPSMQSLLALMFYEAQEAGINFIIETHSEYLVRKTQSIVANMKDEEEFKHNPFVVYYFNEDGSAYDLEYTQSGRFSKNFGSGFFDEASKSSIDILKRERREK